jgi:hypothetical protein
MPHRITLSAIVLAISATSADAADLATQSRLGAVFADPVVVTRRAVVVVQPVRDEAPIIPYNLFPNPLWNRATTITARRGQFTIGPYYDGPYDSTAAALCLRPVRLLLRMPFA